MGEEEGIGLMGLPTTSRAVVRRDQSFIEFGWDTLPAVVITRVGEIRGYVGGVYWGAPRRISTWEARTYWAELIAAGYHRAKILTDAE